MSGLDEYRRRRDFERTAEPAGDAGVHPPDGWFVVQKHAARRLHYDLRLAIGGTLVSWAVAKVPSLDPTVRRLAVRTEDHPLSYGDFEGTIPKGEYGGGTVLVWDRGPADIAGDPATALAGGSLDVTLHGRRLTGGFRLVRLRPTPKEPRESWLLIKKRDAAAAADIDLAVQDTSIDTGRTIPEIAAGDASSARQAPGRRSGRPRPPRFLKPQLATPAVAPPTSGDWLYELKFDGYRMLGAVAGPEVRCYTRSGLDWTARFGPIARRLATLGLGPTLLDGEVVAVREGGRTDFSALQQAIAEAPERLSYFVFDLLVDDGEDIRARPLTERRRRLASRLGEPRPPVYLSQPIDAPGDRILEEACRQGWEGLIAKRADAPYRSRRTQAWRKLKCLRRQEFVVGGISGSQRGRPFASLLLGVHEGARLVYAGRVGTGFDAAGAAALADRLAPLETTRCPFAAVPDDLPRGVRWLKPELVVEVRFTEITAAGHVRHAVFEGLREDKPASEIRREPAAVAGTAVAADRPGPDGESVAGPVPPAGASAPGARRPPRLTNPDRELFPGAGVPKRALAEWFAAAASAMLPHVAGRPVSLVRCASGRDGDCFFQKHPPAGMPDAIGRVPVVDSKGRPEELLRLDTADALAACAQIGGVEIHPWGSRADRIERPDRVVFDLDPDPAVGFAETRRAAVDLAALLREAGLESFPLLTGGKGIHLVVPLERRHDWATVAAFTADFAGRVAGLDPGRFVATMTKARRTGRIFVDHFRNRRGTTAIAPFSPRARPGTPVAVPVDWDELAAIDRADLFRLADLVREPASRLKAWAGYAETRQRLTRAGLARLGLVLRG